MIVSVGGSEVIEFDDLLTCLSSETQVGQTIELGVLRGSAMIELNVTLKARPHQEA